MNFIKYIEELYISDKSVFAGTRFFQCYYPVSISIAQTCYDCFEVRHYITVSRKDRTQLLYGKGGVRLYLSDADILEMLLSNTEDSKRKKIIKAFHSWLLENYNEKCTINLQGDQFEFPGIKYDAENTLYYSRDDIAICESHLFAFINLILAKDLAVTDIMDNDINYAVRTIKKYIILLQWYWYNIPQAETELHRIGYNTEKELLENFLPADKVKWANMNQKFENVTIAYD